MEALQNLSDIFVSPPNRTAQTPERPAIVQRMAAPTPQLPALASTTTVQRVAAPALQPSATAPPIVIVQRVLPIVLPPVPIHDALPIQRVIARIEEASLQRVVAPTPPPAISERLANLRTMK